MARILLLEDNEQSRTALIKILEELSKDITVDAAATLAEARELLDSTVSFDLFLLDVNLDPDNEKDASGLTFAEEVRNIRNYEVTPMIMITSIASLEISAYRKVHCYQYIIKPFKKSEVTTAVGKILDHLQTDERAAIVIKKDSINYRLYCDEIVYIQAIPRGVCLYLKTEKLAVLYLTIRQLMEKLPAGVFFQCHRMFVVNQNYIKYYDLVNQVIQMEGYPEGIDIGGTYKAECRRRMNE